MDHVLATIFAATIALSACGGAAQPAASVAPRSSAAANELDALRSRGTLTVSIRVEAPPAARPAGDPAHAQKRAFESAVATLVAQRVIGPAAKVDLRSAGADRIGPVERGEADVAMASVGPSGSTAAALSRPFAAAGIVVAVPAATGTASVEDLRGKAIAVAMDETGARDALERFLATKGLTWTLQNAQGVRGAAELVSSGAAAALVGDRTGVLVLERDKPGTLRIIAEVEPRSFVIAVRRSATTLLAEIDKALEQLLASGEIARAAGTAGLPYEAAR